MSVSIEKSELVIARILSFLVGNGLQESQLSFKTLNLPVEYQPFFQTCIRWLIDEDFIRVTRLVDSISSMFHVYGAVLTSKGFAILGHKFSINGGDVTAAQLVKEKSEGAANISGIGDFLGGILGGFTKSLGSG